MKNMNYRPMKTKPLINILLADDDQDDCMLFKEALEELALDTSLRIVNDGGQLIRHLEAVSANLPDVIFLDLNMPRKNGFECLKEIKQHSVWQNLPVIIISTSYDLEKADLLYRAGANYYITKPSDFQVLKYAVHNVVTLVTQSHGSRTRQPTKEKFFINKIENAI